MNCNQTQEFISQQLDDEITESNLRKLNDHFQECKECRTLKNKYKKIDKKFDKVFAKSAHHDLLNILELPEEIIDVIRTNRDQEEYAFAALLPSHENLELENKSQIKFLNLIIGILAILLIFLVIFWMIFK